jgi:hypothetical protein
MSVERLARRVKQQGFVSADTLLMQEPFPVQTDREEDIG